jgi:hypothetical protein
MERAVGDGSASRHGPSAPRPDRAFASSNARLGHFGDPVSAMHFDPSAPAKEITR